MNDLRDMGRFPVPIYVGATGNVLMTIILTYLVQGRYPDSRMLPRWGGGVIVANLLPVLLLRSRMDEATRYPQIEEMDFIADQHKFARWVYAVASANMLFWISLSWHVFSRRRDGKTLAGLLLLAFVCTFYSAWIRLFKSS
jgi:hypothetical protein